MSSQMDSAKTAAVPFSYAQAARGASNSASTQSSKAPSGAITPSKERAGGLKSELNGARWADSLDDDAKEASTGSASTAVDGSTTPSLKSSATQHSGLVNGVTSSLGADMAGASTSTVVRDDGPSPQTELPESAWESKSQGMSKAENGRNRGPADRASSRGRKKSGKKGERKEKAESELPTSKTTFVPPVKLVEAPAPTVNPWLARAQQTKPPAVPKPAPTSAAIAVSTTNDQRPKEASTTKSAPGTTEGAVETSTSSSKKDVSEMTTEKPKAEEKPADAASAPPSISRISTLFASHHITQLQLRAQQHWKMAGHGWRAGLVSKSLRLRVLIPCLPPP